MNINKLILLLFLFMVKINFAQTKVIDQRTGILIIFSAEEKIFPESWYSARINAKAASLSKNEYQRSERVLKQALEKYPVSLLIENLKKIYVLKSMEFYGSSFGGTNSNDIVYLSNNGQKKGYTDFYLEQLFHAEFSSILLRNYSYFFDKQQWINSNPDDFSYGKGGVNALKKNADSEEFDEKLNQSGFINQYSVSSLENDFNAYAKNLFLPKVGFNKLVENYEAIRKKRKLVIRFYDHLDGFFSVHFFDNILYPDKE